MCQILDKTDNFEFLDSNLLKNGITIAISENLY